MLRRRYTRFSSSARPWTATELQAARVLPPRYDGGRTVAWALAVPLVPLDTIVHSMGTIAGILDPPETVLVTEKVRRR